MEGLISPEVRELLQELSFLPAFVQLALVIIVVIWYVRRSVAAAAGRSAT